MPSILIAGGGTGGHVFPGIAVANALRALADVEVIFAGSPRGLESRIVPAHGYTLELLDIEPMKGGGPSRALRGALVAARATRDARAFVARHRPSAVLSVGGYAAGPASLACVSRGVPLAILEPNSTLGLTNRLLAPFAKRAFVAWSETARIFRGGKARTHGVPLRAGFEPRPYAAREDGTKRVLVLGGSQGARALNESLPGALAKVLAGRKDVRVLHQAGRDRDDDVRVAYDAHGLGDIVTVAPFVDDVAAEMVAADLILARSGAVTVAEIASIGRASILVPFPHAADDHQAKNALALAELGGAICVRQENADEARLAHELEALLGDDARRTAMANAARDHGRPDAARDIALDLLALARIAPKKKVEKKKTNGAANGSSVRIPSAKEVS